MAMPSTEIIRFADLTESRWKNGGGMTREIARATIGDSRLWRLSLADVTGKGPFSDFAEFIRILTVVKGQGMLLLSEGVSIAAEPWLPVRFSGALKINGQLKSGPVHNYNFMYNPDFCVGDVVVLRGPLRRLLAVEDECLYIVYCLAGTLSIDQTAELAAGDTALIGADAGPLVLQEGDGALLISIELNSGCNPGSVVVATR